MTDYTTKNALVDLGFVDGFLRMYDMPDDDIMFDCVLDALDRIDSHVASGALFVVAPMDHKAESRFLHDLGFIRGMLWKQKTPHAVSEAITRVIGFATSSSGRLRSALAVEQRFEAEADRLSDDQREAVLTAGENAQDSSSAQFAESIGASQLGVLTYWCRIGAMTQDEVQEEIQASTPAPALEPVSHISEVVPSAQSIPADQVGKVRELSETMTDEEVGNELGVSRDTVIRFRKKHGIEKENGPREGRTRWEYQWQPWQKQKLIEMKLAGHSYGEIAAVVGKTASQCSGMWFWEKKKLKTAPESGSAVQAVPELVAAVTAIAPADVPVDDTPARVTVSAPGWEPTPIDPADWPDIQRMLAAGRTKEAIAGDYDVPTADLERFVAEQTKAMQPHPLEEDEADPSTGEAQAPHPPSGERRKDGESETAKVQAFIKKHGVTLCPGFGTREFREMSIAREKARDEMASHDARNRWTRRKARYAARGEGHA